MDRIITYSLADDFIRKTADYVEENFCKKGRDLGRLAFVFGGRRPALFLKKELSLRLKKSFFPPRFFAIDDFVEYILSQREDFSRISDLDACFAIYKIAKATAAEILEGRESFAKFLPWARQILAFIEQLDLEDIRAEALKNIQFKATIGYDIPESINSLLARIVFIRQAYQAELKAKKTYSRGLSYLLAAESVGECAFAEFEEMIFCGFFYLHKTERKIIKDIYDRQKATLIFQGDRREWSVLDDLLQDFSSCAKVSPGNCRGGLINLPYGLCVQAGFDIHSQVCLAREALKKSIKPEKTVVVLPNPETLIPLLSEISAQIKDFNVSLGYPLKRSALYSLFECLFKAQESRKGSHYYAKDYLACLTHPIVKNLKILSSPSMMRVLAHKIEEVLLGIEKTSLSGSLFVDLGDIQDSKELYDSLLLTMKNMDLEVSRNQAQEALFKLHDILFRSWERVDNFNGFSLSLAKFLDVLAKNSYLGKYPLNIRMMGEIFTINDELSNASFTKEPFPKEEIFKIFKNRLESQMVSFTGSPLKGLQVLGLFETRSLHFENVIILDANESALPNLRISEPLIPREVMISLGLNRLEKEEEIQRYQFRRLIAGAKNVHLIYQQRDDKEKSRFIEELIWERQQKEMRLDVLAIPRASFKTEVLPKKVSVEKDGKMLDFLKSMEYSASSINAYLHCPLRFYYQYVLGLKEREGGLEEPQAAEIGTFIHELLLTAFSRFIGKKPKIDGKFMDDFFVLLDKKFSDEFAKKMKSDSFLVKEMLNFRLRKFMENESRREIREILCLEKLFQVKLSLKSGTFKFKAIIDRIDRVLEDEILIIDYKTGSQELMPQNAERIEERGMSRGALKSSIRSFQLPLYLHCIDHQPDYAGLKTNAALYALKSLDKDMGLSPLFKEEQDIKYREKAMSVYLAALDSLLQDILDPAVPFKADEADSRRCSNCPFFYLCR